MYKLLIFDLDGTLLNTITDLAMSVNYALKQHRFPTHPVDEYRYFVGNGIAKLIERALPTNASTPDNLELVKKTFVDYYNLHNTEYTFPYNGIPKLLTELQYRGLLLAVASNKYHQATTYLIDKLFPDVHFAAVFGQRQDVPVKPNPQIVYDIMMETGMSVENTLYIGDSSIDMQTASNAGVTSVGVTWGFRPRTELVANGACHIVDTPEEILLLLRDDK
ncbi:MAG: HAD family hydrolase [Tannerella sp.]|nr:HAD family hydrolase [Tannerella sp.]